MKWVDALKVYNTGKSWCVPRKGSPEHAEVMKIMGKSKVESPAAPIAAAKMSVSKAEAVKQIKAHKEKEGKVSSMAAKVKERKAMRLLKTLVAVRRAKKAAAPKAKKEPTDGYEISMMILDELREIVERELTGVPDNERDEYINENFNELVTELGGGYGDFDEVTNELEKRLGYSPKTLVKGMKYMRTNEGFTMFDDYIEKYSKK